jgi:hypothetical protein
MSGGPDARLKKRPWHRGGSRWYLDGVPVGRRERREYLHKRRKAQSRARKEV